MSRRETRAPYHPPSGPPGRGRAPGARDHPPAGGRSRSDVPRVSRPDREDQEDRPGPHLHPDRAAADPAPDVRPQDRPVRSHHARHDDRRRRAAVAAPALADRPEPRGARRRERRSGRGARQHRAPVRAGRRPPAHRRPGRRDVRRQPRRDANLPREPQAQGHRDRSLERPRLHPGPMEPARAGAGRDHRVLAARRHARGAAVLLVLGPDAARRPAAGRRPRRRRPGLRRRRGHVLRVAVGAQRAAS